MAHLRYVATSDVGLVRTNNQDSGYASPTMLMVADGMGGAAAGDVASAIAIRHMRDVDSGELSGDDMVGSLDAALNQANTTISDMIARDPSLDGMGTTVCGAMFDGRRLGLVHLGDSRGYLLRGGKLTRITHDHSWVQSLIDEGRITEEQSLTHPHRSLVLKVLNGTTNTIPDHDIIDVSNGDRVMFCSDGLNGMISDDAIRTAMAIPDLDEASATLLADAHEAGGFDNITIVMADVVSSKPDVGAPISVGAVLTVDVDDAIESTTKIPVVRDEPSAADDERYRPAKGGSRRRLWTVLGSLALLTVLLVGGVFGLRAATAGQHYLAADGDVVAIMRGIPDRIGPVTFSELSRDTAIRLDNLPPLYRDNVINHQYRDMTLTEAEDTVTQLNRKAAECVAARRARANGQSPSTTTRQDEC